MKRAKAFEDLFSNWLKGNDYDHYSFFYEDGSYLAILGSIPSELNADEYNKVTDILDSAAVKRENYVINLDYDVSGYDYWHRFDDEENWIGISVYVSEKAASENALEILYEIGKMIDNVNDEFIANNINAFI